jgi:D-alanyl-D-alanine carboxypeptidase
VVNFPQDQQFFEVQNYMYGNRTVYSNNQMLKLYPGATGMKTGYTLLARHNLITSATRNGRVLIGVVLHEPSWGDTYTEMTAMLDSGFGGHISAGTEIAANQPPVAVAPPQPAAPVTNVLSHHNKAANAQPIQLASKDPVSGSHITGWTAQVGVYSHMSKARVQAMAVQHMRGVGIARIAKLQSHGKTLWTAQLAGLTQTAAHKTCNVLAAKGDSCLIIAPQADHLAMQDTSAG